MNVKFRFRSKSSGRVLNVSQVCSSSYDAEFYNIVFSHGDGSLQNYPDRELCAKQNFKNDDPIAFCICRYIDLFIAFYIFSIRSGFNVRNISPRNSSMRQSHSLSVDGCYKDKLESHIQCFVWSITFGIRYAHIRPSHFYMLNTV